jgi:hypothetical protein
MSTATKDAPDTVDVPPPPPPEVNLTAAGDPAPPASNPLILNDAYFEMSGVNLRCLVKHLEAAFPENKVVTVTSMCGETDYPGVTKWHLRVTFYQDFSPNSVFATLQAAITAYQTNGTPVAWKARPYSSRVASTTNPIISGLAIPQPIPQLLGDAGAASEVQIDWNLTAPPTVDYGAVTATGATAGAPGYFTPTGATVPANLAALTGLTANPATAWTPGQYVITADLLANHWSSSAWVAGKA